MADQDRMDTLSQAIARLRSTGYRADMTAAADGLHCGACGTVTAAEHVVIEEIVRFEGTSDPDDESILFALIGDCGHHGLYAAPYGPDASADDAAVMRGLHRR